MYGTGEGGNSIGARAGLYYFGQGVPRGRRNGLSCRSSVLNDDGIAAYGFLVIFPDTVKRKVLLHFQKQGKADTAARKL